MTKDANHWYGHGPYEPDGLESQQTSGGDFRQGLTDTMNHFFREKRDPMKGTDDSNLDNGNRHLDNVDTLGGYTDRFRGQDSTPEGEKLEELQHSI